MSQKFWTVLLRSVFTLFELWSLQTPAGNIWGGFVAKCSTMSNFPDRMYFSFERWWRRDSFFFVVGLLLLCSFGSESLHSGLQFTCMHLNWKQGCFPLTTVNTCTLTKKEGQHTSVKEEQITKLGLRVNQFNLLWKQPKPYIFWWNRTVPRNKQVKKCRSVK